MWKARVRPADRCGLRFTQAGLTLPDESFYSDELHSDVRTAYAEHVTRMFSLLGSEDPTAEATAVLDLETAIAGHHWDRVRSRDDTLADNHLNYDDLLLTAPLPWSEFLAGLGIDATETLVVQVRQPDFLIGVASLLAERPLEQWKSWLTWRLLHARADLLHEAIASEHFDFMMSTLTGQPEQPPRWKRSVKLTEQLLGEELGHLYVYRYLSPAVTATMESLTERFRGAFRSSLSGAEWLASDTREAALRKLEAIRVKIGGPTQERDLSGVQVRPGDLVGNVRRIAAFNHDHELAKLKRAVDPDDWVVPGHTVNAFYMPLRNEVYFPAGILQPPYLDPEASDAFNYGAIGEILGHEMGHAFDDQGSDRDAHGALENWWSEEDRAAFRGRAEMLVAQFDALSPRSLGAEFTVDGRLTLGENIGDLIGIRIAHDAWRSTFASLPTQQDEREFFIAQALRWRGMDREQTAIRRLTTDPHPPVEFRANIVRNLDAFHDAFDVRPGDGLWLEPEERARIF